VQHGESILDSVTTLPCAAPCDASASTRVLLLGGTSEARHLAARIAADTRLDGVVSLAGRTSAPLAQNLPTRIGGFGGADGLARFLVEQRIARVIDATHPFAARISANARAACAALGVPLLAVRRAPWERGAGDRWIEVADLDAAAQALGAAPRRVFLTIGRQGVGAFRTAPQHDYLLRVIEAPEAGELPPRCDLITARGPFSRADEIALMRERRVDSVVTKNSGGAETYAKIEAARDLALAVVMVARPPSAGAAVYDIDAAMDFLTAPVLS
jgi:precorrin-6A/cobalt-precorrin-6A reductase